MHRTAAQVAPAPFELPDGVKVMASVERFMERRPNLPHTTPRPHPATPPSPHPIAQVPELLINPAPLGSGANPSLGKMFATAVYQCEPEFRKDLYGGVVITGGGSTFPGFAERVSRELPQHLPEVRSGTSTSLSHPSVLVPHPSAPPPPPRSVSGSRSSQPQLQSVGSVHGWADRFLRRLAASTRCGCPG